MADLDEQIAAAERDYERTYTLREVAQKFGVNLDSLTDDIEDIGRTPFTVEEP